MDINAVEWNVELSGVLLSAFVGPYSIYVHMEMPDSPPFVNVIRRVENSDYQTWFNTPLPNWLAASLPGFGPGLLLDWLAEQGIG